MNTVFFVALEMYDLETEESFISTYVTQDVASESEALGLAINHKLTDKDDCIKNFEVRSWEFPEPKKSNHKHHMSMALNTFLELIKMQDESGNLIRAEVLRIAQMSDRIQAIKYLRDRLKPFVGLKGSKEIVDTWLEELDNSWGMSSLRHLVVHRLNEDILKD